MWKDDEELFALMRTRLFPAVVGDILDTMGLLRQFLSPGIRPLRSDMVVCGRAMPVLETNCFAAREPAGKLELSRKPFGLLFEALDDPVLVVSGGEPDDIAGLFVFLASDKARKVTGSLYAMDGGQMAG